MGFRIARVVAGMAAVVAALAGIASAAGILLRGDLATTPFTTVRGEVVPMVMDGIYRYNAEAVVAEGVGWDLVTLLLVVPVTIVAAVLLWRGSLRAALVMGGLLAYFAYQYFEYLMFWAYGPLYPIHLLTGALGISALVLLIAGFDLAALPRSIDSRFPRRAVVGFSIAVAVVLCGLWLPTIIGTLGGEVTDELNGASTLVVPAFDLGLLVPLAVFTAVAVARRASIGYVLAMIVLVKGVCMALAIVAMLVVEWQVTGEALIPPMVIFGILALVSLAIGVRAVRAIHDEPTATTSRRHAPAPA